MSKNRTRPLPNQKNCLIMLCLMFFAAPLAVAEPARKNERAKKGVINEKNNLKLVHKLKTYYNSYSDYTAEFVQTTSHKMFTGKLKRAYGHVKFKKGGLMRWEYNRPEKKFFIYDGQILWVYEPEVPQIFEGAADTERLRRALAFLTGEGNILKEYRTKTLSSKKFGFDEGHVLGLWPKDKTSPFEHVELYLDKSTFQVVRSVVVDRQGNRNRFDFFNMEKNKGLHESVFRFKKPPGVPVHKIQQ